MMRKIIAYILIIGVFLAIWFLGIWIIYDYFGYESYIGNHYYISINDIPFLWILLFVMGVSFLLGFCLYLFMKGEWIEK